MPSSRRAPLRRTLPGLVLPIALALAACSSPGDPIHGGSQPRVDLQLRLLDAGDTVPQLLYGQIAGAPVRLAPAGGLIHVSGQLWPGEANGRPRRVVDGRVVVNGVALAGDVPSGQRMLGYFGDAGVPRADGTVTLAFPRIDGIAPVTLQLRTIARAEGVPVVLTGDELRIRVVPPPSPVAAPFYNPQWSVELVRGARATRVTGTTPLPRELVLPVGSLLPGTGPVTASLTYSLGATNALGAPPPSDTTYTYGLTLQASLRFAPVAP